MLSPAAEEQLRSRGISEQELTAQLERFRKGAPFASLDRAATPGDGILQWDPEQVAVWIRAYERNMQAVRCTKFVPASGAATRMFKQLFELLEQGEDGFTNFHATFFDNLPSFAFYDELAGCLAAKGLNLEDCRATRHWKPIVEALLLETCLHYAALPKALLPFHRYEDGPRLSLEEHLAEAVAYASDSWKVARVHFTVSPQHLPYVSAAVDNRKDRFEEETETIIEATYSTQKLSTDTVAVDLHNEPATNADGTLIFRPGGHGALLENLNELDSELIFIKNIDNVVPRYRQEDTIVYKKALAGYLLAHQRMLSEYLAKLADGPLNQVDWDALKLLGTDMLNVALPDHPNLANEVERQEIIDLLNRPIRICGMVRNEGEPGGGPFWVKGSDGRISLQIVESAQINTDDSAQAAILSGATHFNPVDLVCYVHDYQGKPFDLRKYRDDDACFITEKSVDGRPVKALELPGLWNGAMANWITVFVEVPLSTFNPVKTVNDLLKEGHQPLAR